MPVALFSRRVTNLLLFLPLNRSCKKAAIVKLAGNMSIFSSISVFMLGAIVSLPS